MNAPKRVMYTYMDHLIEIEKVQGVWELTIEGRKRSLTFPTLPRAKQYARVFCDPSHPDRQL